MKNTRIVLMILTALFYFNFTPQTDKSCSVVVLNNQWLINSYQKDEKATISKSAAGVITVRETGDVSKKSFEGKKIKFKISIQKKDGTLKTFTEQIIESINAEELLKSCSIGDKILIQLKEEDRFSLPHNLIEVI